MKLEIGFGKVDGYHIGKRNCLLTLEWGFSEFEGQEPYFSVCGNLWNNIQTDIIHGGQCLDSFLNEFKELKRNKTYMAIYKLWKKYHLKKKSVIPKDELKRIEMLYNYLKPYAIKERKN